MPRPTPKKRLPDYFGAHTTPVDISEEDQERLIDAINLDPIDQEDQCQELANQVAKVLGDFETSDTVHKNVPTPKESAASMSNMAKPMQQLIDVLENIDPVTEDRFNSMRAVGEPPEIQEELWTRLRGVGEEKFDAPEFDRLSSCDPDNLQLNEKEKARRRKLPEIPTLQELREFLEPYIQNFDYFVNYNSKLSSSGRPAANAVSDTVYSLHSIFLNHYDDSEGDTAERENSLVEFVKFSLQIIGQERSEKTLKSILQDSENYRSLWVT